MIDSFLRYISYEKRFSAHTLTSYSNDLGQLSDFLQSQYPDTKIQDADHHMVRSWIIFLSESGLKPRSINRKIASIKSFYKFLLKREEITVNPTVKIRPLKTEKKLPTFIKEGEMERLLDGIYFETNFKGVRDKLAVELFYSTGIRLSELINLKIADFNQFEQNIKVLGKRNKERIIPISGNIVNLINEYITIARGEFGDKNSEYLMLTDSGEKTYPGFIYRLIKKYLGQVSFADKRSPHVLRHTFATHLLNNGADLNAVKDLLGHTSLAATQVYTHNSLDKLKKVFDQAHPKA